MKRFGAVLILAVICIPAGTTECYALDFDPRCVNLEYSDAPDGTAYIDLLVKKDEIGDDMYTDFNAPPQRWTGSKLDANKTTVYLFEDLDIDSGSDIANRRCTCAYYMADTKKDTVEEPDT